MHGFVLTDEQAGAGSNLVTWLDERAHSPHPAGGGSYFDVLSTRITADEFRSTGGIELRPGVPAGALFWLAENRRLPRPGMMPVAVGDFVVARLCRTRPVTEVTNAHAHGLLKMETGDWHRGVIEKLGLGGLVFPEIRPQGSIVDRSGWLAAKFPPLRRLATINARSAAHSLPRVICRSISRPARKSACAIALSSGRFRPGPSSTANTRSR